MSTLPIGIVGEVKLYRHEPNRRVEFSDLNTIAGLNLDGSALNAATDMIRALIGQTAARIYLGFGTISHTADEITIGAGLILTGTRYYRVAQQTITVPQEARTGHLEYRLVEQQSDEVSADFWDITVRRGVPGASHKRQAYRVEMQMIHSSFAIPPVTTEGWTRIANFERVAAFQPLQSATWTITPARSLEQLRQQIEQEAVNRNAAIDAHNYIRTPDTAEQIQIYRQGQNVFWSNDGGTTKYPFA